MTAQTFQFPRYPAEQARRLAGGPSWGRRSALGLASGLILLLGGRSFSTFQPREAAIGMISAGLALLVFSLVAIGIWVWRALHKDRGRPWGRLFVAGLCTAWVVDVA